MRLRAQGRGGQELAGRRAGVGNNESSRFEYAPMVGLPDKVCSTNFALQAQVLGLKTAREKVAVRKAAPQGARKSGRAAAQPTHKERVQIRRRGEPQSRVKKQNNNTQGERARALDAAAARARGAGPHQGHAVAVVLRCSRFVVLVANRKRVVNDWRRAARCSTTATTSHCPALATRCCTWL